MAKKGLLIFDMDGVLVDVTDSYRAAIKDTVQHFTGVEISNETIQDCKNEGGWNDDWLLSQHLIRKTGLDITYDETVAYFQHIFHEGGLMQRERWIAQSGRARRACRNTTRSLSSPDASAGKRTSPWSASPQDSSNRVVGVDDVATPKPAPDGILLLQKARSPPLKPYATSATLSTMRSPLSPRANVSFVGIAAPENPRYEDLKQLLVGEMSHRPFIPDINHLKPYAS